MPRAASSRSSGSGAARGRPPASAGGSRGTSCRRLDTDTWNDLVKLFGPNGACGGCWCMWWRVPRGGKTWEELAGEKARRALRALAARGEAHGLLAYREGEPVGWCTFGPRAQFPRLGTVKAYAGLDEPPGLWCVPCFFIRRDWRGRGLARELLDAALVEMKRAGARLVEAYPVTTTRDGRRVAASFAYTGPLSLYTRAGFRVVHEANPLKPVVRKALGR